MEQSTSLAYYQNLQLIQIVGLLIVFVLALFFAIAAALMANKNRNRYDDQIDESLLMTSDEYRKHLEKVDELKKNIY